MNRAAAKRSGEARVATTWPAISFESVPWTPRAEDAMSNTARRRHAGPYEAAIPPSIAAISEVPIGRDAVELAEEAMLEIVRFDAELGTRLVPFSTLLLRSESAASSRIEQLTATAKAIALAELGDARSKNATLIVSNVAAMRAALALADQMDAQSILEMHRALLADEHPDWVGRWRSQQVWIGGDRWGPHGAAFVPPRHDRVSAAIDDLVAFIARTDVSPLVQAALAHAQFETIHPFPYGNGRTGRALIHAMLRHRRITRNVTIPVSSGLLVETSAYFDALTAFRQGDADPIVIQLAEAAFSAINNGRTMVAELDDVRSTWQDTITARSDSSAWRLADLLFRQPAVNSATVQAELGVTAATANNTIEQLVTAGVLVKARGDQRNRAWVATAIVEVLDAFAARAGRRSRAA